MKKYIYMTKQNKRIVIIVICVALFLDTITMIRCITNISPVISQREKYNYTIIPAVSYTVNLLPNDFIEESSLPEGESYIHDIVKDIDFTFQVTVDGENISDVVITGSTYNELQGVETGDDQEETVLWTRDYPMSKEKSVEDDVSKFTSNVSLSDYEVDSDLASQQLGYDGTTKLSTICEGVVSFTADGQQITEPFRYSMIVPLEENVFTITQGDNQDIAQTISDSVETAGTMDKQKVNFLIGLDIILGLLLILIIWGVKAPGAELLMQKKTAKQIRSYGKLIVLYKEPLQGSLCSLEVKDFDNLAELSHQLQQPVFVYDQKYYVFDGSNQYWCFVP